MIVFIKIAYYGQHKDLEIPFARQTLNARDTILFTVPRLIHDTILQYYNTTIKHNKK